MDLGWPDVPPWLGLALLVGGVFGGGWVLCRLADRLLDRW